MATALALKQSRKEKMKRPNSKKCISLKMERFKKDLLWLCCVDITPETNQEP